LVIVSIAAPVLKWEPDASNGSANLGYIMALSLYWTKANVGARMAEPEIWSFFSGGMGLDLGLEQAGFTTTLANEIDPVCCETIRGNRPKIDLIEGDVATLEADELRKKRGNPDEVFLMVGGPPCQSFSTGGKRAALSDPRGNLIYVYLRLISRVQPRYFVLENVANLTTAALRHRPIEDRPGKHWSLKKYQSHAIQEDGAEPMQPDELSGSAIRQLFADLSELGYHVNFGVVSAADYGAPQKRMRFIMIGARNGKAPELPCPTYGVESQSRMALRTVRDAIFDLREKPGEHSEYTPSVARYFDLIPPGGNWRHLPDELKREAMGKSYDAGGGKTGFYRRLAWDEPAPTITGRSNRKGTAMCHPEFTRPLSVRECARLQGFPDSWEFSGSMASKYLQIGNAVPVPLGRAVAEAIAQHASQAHKVSQTTFDLESMLSKAVTRLRATARNKTSYRAENATGLLFG
jgi:DNA (cytosine-5)-methyltransferase 1